MWGSSPFMFADITSRPCNIDKHKCTALLLLYMLVPRLETTASVFIIIILLHCFCYFTACMFTYCIWLSLPIQGNIIAIKALLTLSNVFFKMLSYMQYLTVKCSIFTPIILLKVATQFLNLEGSWSHHKKESNKISNLLEPLILSQTVHPIILLLTNHHILL